MIEKMNKIKIRKKNKKGMVRTLEAFFAIFITFMFLIFFFSNTHLKNVDRERQDYLSLLNQNNGFRDCVINEDVSCVRNYVDDVLPTIYAYEVSIGKGSSSQISLPDKKIYIDSLFISGNTTNYDDKTVKIYYWEK